MLRSNLAISDPVYDDCSDWSEITRLFWEMSNRSSLQLMLAACCIADCSLGRCASRSRPEDSLSVKKLCIGS